MGRNEAMSNDRRNLKEQLIKNFGLKKTECEFGHWDPQLEENKLNWGFRHPQLGQALAPHTYKWDDIRFVRPFYLNLADNCVSKG